MLKYCQFAGFALILASVPAAAKPSQNLVADELPEVTVDYADLDLGSSSGRQALESRVARAAAKLCSQIGRKPLADSLEERRCTQVATASARAGYDQAVSNSAAGLATRGTFTVSAK